MIEPLHIKWGDRTIEMRPTLRDHVWVRVMGPEYIVLQLNAEPRRGFALARLYVQLQPDEYLRDPETVVPPHLLGRIHAATAQYDQHDDPKQIAIHILHRQLRAEADAIEKAIHG